MRIFEPATIRRAITEHSYLELDLSLGFPLRYGLGFMLGARWLSLYGPDTEMAFGHLGFTNMLGWADPERAISGALLTSGKPILYAELTDLWSVLRTIGARRPRSSARCWRSSPTPARRADGASISLTGAREKPRAERAATGRRPSEPDPGHAGAGR